MVDDVKPAKILVVDDEPGMRMTLKGILARKGYRVTLAENGIQALEEVRKADFGIILMDVKMSGMNGVEAFLEIKEISPRSTVIMMTGFAVEDLLKQAMQEGAYGVVYKPLEMPKILAIINECLQKKIMILVVDDDSTLRAFLKVSLEKKGYEVVEAASGEDCLTQVKWRKFQVILLDIVLPGINGVETLKRIKEIRPDANVIVMTGHSVEAMVLDAVKSGSPVCLHKPIAPDKLIEVVNRYSKLKS